MNAKGQGRKKKPVEMKLHQGTARKDRLNSDMPDSSSRGMRAPLWLPREAVEHFGVLKTRVEGIGQNSETYTEAMAMAALCIFEIERLTVIISSDPTYETTTRDKERIVKSHPAVEQRLKYIHRLQSLLAEFGLTPSAIQRVGSASSGKGDKWKDFING